MELAKKAGTISYELLARVHGRVTRTYSEREML
jgi:alanine racemase